MTVSYISVLKNINIYKANYKDKRQGNTYVNIK